MTDLCGWARRDYLDSLDLEIMPLYYTLWRKFAAQKNTKNTVLIIIAPVLSIIVPVLSIISTVFHQYLRFSAPPWPFFWIFWPKIVK